MASTSPMQRSLKLLRDRGYLCGIVERRLPFNNITQDLYGFGDILAIKPGSILLVQTTSGSNVSKRVTKIVEHLNYPRVVDAGVIVHVHGWRKLVSGWACKEVIL